MKQQLKSYSWFLFPLSLPSSQRYALLLALFLSITYCWWSLIYNPLRKQRATLMQQLYAPNEDEIIHSRLRDLKYSLQQLSCKELTTIASLSRVTFEEIKLMPKQSVQLTFVGTYDAVIECLQELYERCPQMHIDRMHIECRDSLYRCVHVEISNMQLMGDAPCN